MFHGSSSPDNSFLLSVTTQLSVSNVDITVDVHCSRCFSCFTERCSQLLRAVDESSSGARRWFCNDSVAKWNFDRNNGSTVLFVGLHQLPAQPFPTSVCYTRARMSNVLAVRFQRTDRPWIVTFVFSKEICLIASPRFHPCMHSQATLGKQTGSLATLRKVSSLVVPG